MSNNNKNYTLMDAKKAEEIVRSNVKKRRRKETTTGYTQTTLVILKPYVLHIQFNYYRNTLEKNPSIF